MEKMHSLLKRQLRKYFNDSLEVPQEWQGFLEMVNSAYYEFDTDRNMLEIVARNLFSNAIKFTDKGGSIRIKAKEADGIIIISVSDSGIGIEKSRIEKIFSYSEGYSTLGTNEEKGTGLGLMICKQLIEKNNGRIWVESNEGIGSSFYFTIPASKSCERK